MIIKRDIEAFLQSPPIGIMAVLFHGPNDEASLQKAHRLFSLIAGDPNDPFRASQLSSRDIEEKPERLANEMSSMALGGGRRAVLLVRPEKKHTDIIKKAIQNMQTDNAFLTIVCERLEAGHALRNFFEKSENLAAIAQYAPNYNETVLKIKSSFKDQDIIIDPQALNLLWQIIGEEGQLSKLDIEKMVLFAGKNGHIDDQAIDHLFPSLMKSHAQSLLYDAFDGNHKGLEKNIEMMKNQEIAPIAVLRMILEHIRQLENLIEIIKVKKISPEVAIKSLKPMPFFKWHPRLIHQMSIWEMPSLNRLIARAVETERNIRLGAATPELLCARFLFGIAAYASRRGVVRHHAHK